MWWVWAQERGLPKLEEVAPERPGVTNVVEPPKCVESSDGSVAVKSGEIERSPNNHGVQVVTSEDLKVVVEADEVNDPQTNLQESLCNQ